MSYGKEENPILGISKCGGCLAYCKNNNPRTKMGPRGIKCAFVGYATNSKAYRLLNLESNVIIESRDVEFFENLLTSGNNYQSPLNKESQVDTSPKVVEQPSEPRRSKRIRKAKELGSDEIDSQLISFYLVEGNREKSMSKMPIILQVEDDPKTYKEAMS